MRPRAAQPLWLAYLLVLILAFGVLVDRQPREPAIPTSGPSHGGDERTEQGAVPLWQQLFRPSTGSARLLMRLGLPAFGGEQALAKILLPDRPADLILYMGTEARLAEPASFFETLLPFLKQRPRPPVPQATITVPNQNGPTDKPPANLNTSGPVTASGPLVGIYHTHWWESYVSEMPKNAEPPFESVDSAKSVVSVGSRLADGLRKKGIYSVHATAKPESPDGYTGAYMESLKVAQYVLKQYPSVKILIDLHRDSAPRENMIATIGGKTVAKVGIVVGMGSENLAQPRAPQNMAFAKQLAETMERKFPGLLYRIDPQQARFNQHLSPGSLILEMGSQENTLEEVQRSADLIAEVLADLVKSGKLPG